MAVGVIGVGNIGSDMCSNLLKGGYEVFVYDISRERVEAMQKKGAKIAANPGAVGRECEVVFSAVFDFHQNLSILEGSDGLLKNMAAHGTIFVCSTVSSGEARELAAKAAQHNLRLVDCPVSHSPEESETGGLSLMIGSEPEAMAEHRSVLHTVGSHVYFLGGIGMGQAAKVVNNVLVAVHSLAAAEALMLAAKSGIDLKEMYDIIMHSYGRSHVFEREGMRMINRDFKTRGALKILVKDTNMVLNSSEALGLPMFLTGITHALFQIGVNLGCGEEDVSAIVKVLENLSSCSLSHAKK